MAERPVVLALRREKAGPGKVRGNHSQVSTKVKRLGLGLVLVQLLGSNRLIASNNCPGPNGLVRKIAAPASVPALDTCETMTYSSVMAKQLELQGAEY